MKSYWIGYSLHHATESAASVGPTRSGDITTPFREYAEDKVNKLPRYYDRITEIAVLADKSDNINYEIEVIVHVERHGPFIAKAIGEDLYACVDETTDKLERQLSEHKQKLRNRKHKKP